MVNIAYVEELRQGVMGGYLLLVNSGKEYTMARTYKNNLRFLAGAWLGVEI